MSRVALFAAPALLTALTSAANPTCPFQCVPGLEKIGVGVDLTWFTPQVQGQVTPAAIKRPVVNLTATKQSIWTNYYDGNVWGVWDQVSHIYSDPETVTRSQDFTFNDYFSFTKTYEVTVKANLLFGLFTAGLEFNEYLELGLGVGATMKHVSGYVDSYLAGLDPVPYLSPDSDFLKAVSELPTVWWDPISYKQWTDHFNDYGTHFIHSLKAGGNFYYYSFCNNEYVYEYGSAEASVQAKLDFAFILSADGAISAGASESSSAYRESCHSTVHCYGGNANCNQQSSEVYAAWVDSVHSNPWLIDMSYVPNYAILTNNSQLLYAEVTTAYAAWAGLEILAKMCGIAESKYESLIEYFDSFGNGPMNYPICGTFQLECVAKEETVPDYGICAVYSGTALISVYTAWEQGYQNVKSYSAKTTDVCNEIYETLGKQKTDARVLSWIGKTKTWAEEINDYLVRAYSYPMKYESEINYAYQFENQPWCCCAESGSYEGLNYCNYDGKLGDCDNDHCTGICSSSVNVPTGFFTPPTGDLINY